MEFRVRPHTKGEGSPKEKARHEREKHETSSDQDEKSAPESKEHGKEEDSEEESKRAAGEDMSRAMKSGDGMAIFKAHRHLHNVHLTTGPDPDVSDGDQGAAEGGPAVHDLVDQIKGMKKKGD